jgi:2-phospho-L-lactate/phosphoenolpyruvate guanylyltransferase
MSTIAILPIKTFAEAKQRLADELKPGPRKALVEAMFSDVLIALRRSVGISEIVVISADHGAQRIAGGHGATVLEDDTSGHSEATILGIAHALERGIDRVLLVAGDCPLLDPDEIDALVSRPVQRPSVLIIPDRHRTGTNALLLSPPDAVRPSFGPGSCARHANDARAAGATPAVVDVPSMALDVDTPDDLAALRAALESSHGGAAHTRGMLNQLTRSRI